LSEEYVIKNERKFDRTKLKFGEWKIASCLMDSLILAAAQFVWKLGIYLVTRFKYLYYSWKMKAIAGGLAPGILRETDAFLFGITFL
jgi:hypothetical protein